MVGSLFVKKERERERKSKIYFRVDKAPSFSFPLRVLSNGPSK